jgi:C4-dicarboxylate-specific signal transduction histidine kinase
VEKVRVADLMNDALRMNESSLLRHDDQIERVYAHAPAEITVDRHKVIQILVNLVSNAKHACQASAAPKKKVALRVSNGSDTIRIAVCDNGVGIAPENLTRVFSHGFTTKKNGHGFGLHSGALAAKELGGTLTVQSEGPGKGAQFTLELPLEPKTKPPAVAAAA